MAMDTKRGDDVNPWAELEASLPRYKFTPPPNSKSVKGFAEEYGYSLPRAQSLLQTLFLRGELRRTLVKPLGDRNPEYYYHK